MVRSLPGCEKAHILRPAYAIEYDYLPPTQLTPWLETKGVKGLFCAGQINGTSGYEEAGAQGILAGINAVLTLRGESPVVLGRSEAYTGVLVDDLVTKGTREPYRMLTSRCEHRLLLRHDNADRRLAPLGRKLGLLDDFRWNALLRRWKTLEEELERLRSIRIPPSPEVNRLLLEAGSTPLSESVTAEELLRRPETGYALLARIVPSGEPLEKEIRERVEIEVKYAGYVERQERACERFARMEKVDVPADFEWRGVSGLSSEALQKLESVHPRTLGQAGRISGVTPADLQLLWIALERRRRKGSS
jgi:tRNA uridine 5-carboxymethylaminomethyl modification enzyme